MRWPLHRQIMGPLLAVAVVSLVAVGAIYARLAATHTRERIEDQLRGVVGVLITANFPLTEPVLRKMRDLSSADFALTDQSGQVTVTSLPEGRLKLPILGALTRPDDVTLGSTLTLAGRDYFHTAIKLAPADQPTAGRVLHVLFPKDEYRKSLRQAYAPPLYVGVVAVAAAAVAARLLAGRISRATASLGHEVQRLAQGDYRAVVLPATDDEIRDLAQAVNRTAVMLADYERQVRRTEQMRTVAQLGASLAHELRNAATGCRMAVDLHAENCVCGEDDESLVVARRQLKLMESQLQRFLQLGRRPAELVRRSVDLVRLVEELLPLVRPTANHAQALLEWQCTEREIAVVGDQDALGQAALNLLLNAIEAVQLYPNQDGAVRRVVVELKRTPQNRAELTVSDNGPGPAENSISQMFEPFVTSKAEGAGLGLAVAREIVEAHGGALVWSRDNGVTTFRMTLPATVREVSCV